MPSVTASILIFFLHLDFGYKKNRRVNTGEKKSEGYRGKGKGKGKEEKEKASSIGACTYHVTHLNMSRDTDLSPQRKVLSRVVKPQGKY